MLKQSSCFECLSWNNHVAILGDVVSCATEEIAEISNLSENLANRIRLMLEQM